MGQEALGGGYKHVGRMGVGWRVWSWAIIGVNKVKGGEGFTCVLFKGNGKMLGWGSIATRKGWGLVSGVSGGVWFIKMV